MSHIGRHHPGLVALHREAVIRTLTGFLDYIEIEGIPVVGAVSRLYNSLTEDEQLLLCHQEPFDLACDIVGIAYERRLSVYSPIRASYEAMIDELNAVEVDPTVSGATPDLPVYP